jgi:hypothetical protein
VPKPEPTKTEPPVELPKPEPTKTEPPVELPKTEPVKEDTEKKVEEKPADTQVAIVPVPSPKPQPVDATDTPVSEPVEKLVEKPAPDKPKVVGTETQSKPVVENVNDPKPAKALTGTANPGAAKPLFEPIIITIPRPPKVGDGKERARVIDGQEVKAPDIPACSVAVSQDQISIVNGVGIVGILVTLEAPGDITALTATSSSPKDVSVTLEPEIVGMSDRRFYVLKSLTSNLGIYQVTFAAPCGKKDVVINVR